MYEPIKYRDLLRENTALADSQRPRVRIAVLSNITISPIREVLEYSLRSRGINAAVELGDYDNVGQDSLKFRDRDAVVVFYELANIVDQLPFTLHDADEARVTSVIEKATTELGVAFKALAAAKLVLLNLLTALPFAMDGHGASALETICNSVNQFIREHAPPSFKLVDLNKPLVRCSVKESIDVRYFLSSRALYKFPFLRAYAEYVQPIIGVSVGHYKKVLALDCDNTLWKGIVGEDGPQGITIFREIQSAIVALANAGVLICLCSKNNPEDVDAVLTQHPDMVLRDQHVVLKAVNWKEKVSSLQAIADTLNVGLDSFVFLDDSEFELERVRRELPAVTVVKVPADYSEYLWLFQSVASMFYRERTTAADANKTAQYRTEFARQEQRAMFGSEGEFLSSLGLRLRLSTNSALLVPRLAQLTQKTNQFNLTTRRMTEAEVDAATRSPDHLVVGVNVSDRFGDYGITGLIMASRNGGDAHIDNFLLSCRVIGRRVELKAFDAIVDLLRGRGVRTILGTFIPTNKNSQVRSLYETLGFQVVGDDDGTCRYRLDLDRYRSSGIEFIEVEHA